MSKFRGSITFPVFSLSTLSRLHYCTPPKTRYCWLVKPSQTGFSPARLPALRLGAQSRFIGLYWGGENYTIPNHEKQSPFYAVPTIQTVKGRVVFFRKGREKISTLKPLTVWIFAVAISPPKTGNRILQPCPRVRPLHSNGKTVCTTSAAIGRFCGGSAPTPPTSPKEQNGVLRNRA